MTTRDGLGAATQSKNHHKRAARVTMPLVHLSTLCTMRQAQQRSLRRQGYHSATLRTAIQCGTTNVHPRRQRLLCVLRPPGPILKSPVTVPRSGVDHQGARLERSTFYQAGAQKTWTRDQG
ncbi:unnamed protein product [Pylaiella littoralis]